MSDKLQFVAPLPRLDDHRQMEVCRTSALMTTAHCALDGETPIPGKRSSNRMPKSVEVRVKVARKQADLPRFVVIRSSVLKPWGISKTSTVEVAINNVRVERRTLKRWDDDRWFLSITEKDCVRLGVDTGSTVRLNLKLASADLPEELATLLQTDRAAAAFWAKLTSSQQRMLRDEIASAKQSATRARRARKALLT
jgi:hypothetical protein